MLVNGKITCKSPTPTSILDSADDIQHQSQHRLPEVRHICRGQPQHQPDFKFGVQAGVGVPTTPTPDFNTVLEIT